MATNLYKARKSVLQRHVSRTRTRQSNFEQYLFTSVSLDLSRNLSITDFTIFSSLMGVAPEFGFGAAISDLNLWGSWAHFDPIAYQNSARQR